jgi:heme oxygenase (biliverdin-IX-beta and delta-forming)
LNLDARLSSIAAYCDLLRTLWQLHAGYEAAFAGQPWSSGPIDFAARCRSDMLLTDLRALGAADIPHSPSHVPVADLLDAIGCLYVLEGSTLGGQIILRRAGEGLGLTAAGGAGFFHGYGARTGAMWRQLIDAINHIPADSPDADAVEDGARRVFIRFIKMCGDVNAETDAAAHQP